MGVQIIETNKEKDANSYQYADQVRTGDCQICQ